MESVAGEMRSNAAKKAVQFHKLSVTTAFQGPGPLLDSVDVARLRATDALDATRRSDLGQFLTPMAVARLMASMAQTRKDTVRILDAGAGVGSLSAALVGELLSREVTPRRIEVTAFEIDAALAKALKQTMVLCAEACRARGVEFSSEVRSEDFIRQMSEVVEGGLLAPKKQVYDCAILNPPYKKIRTDSPERKRMEAAGLETTNLYTAFLFLSAHLLAPGGELIAITPRSFCNGPYFRTFRREFLSLMRLERIHVFETRDTAFGDDEVLQENIIIDAVRSRSGVNGKVLITSNASPNDPDVVQREVAYREVVDPDDVDSFIHIVPDEMSAAVAQKIGGLTADLGTLGITVSTGRVVDFRATEYLRMSPEPGTVPLFYPGNMIEGRVQWPKTGYRKNQALVDCLETRALMVPAGTYVLVKRFSAKEEPRRIVATVITPGDAPQSSWGFENHLNYFHKEGSGLDRTVACGLAAYLNTSLVDWYFRQFNGHTQVNATDLRSLPFPTLEQLREIGGQIRDRVLPQAELDTLVEDSLGMAARENEIDSVKGHKKIDQALEVLSALGVPDEQRNVRSALTLLALLDLRPHTPWSKAANPLRGITEMLDYFAEHFGKKYAPNTRETVRRFTVHQFVEAGFVVKNPDKPGRPVNSPQAVYQVEAGALEVFRSYGSFSWKGKLAAYLKAVPSLKERYAREREMNRIPVTLPMGGQVTLSPGGQNELIKLIIEEFCERFTPSGFVLYVGDADDKWAIFEDEALKQLGVSVDHHGKMPDVVIHHRSKNWLVLVEAVTSHGPVNPKRLDELKELFKDSKAGLVFVTAFESRPAMVRYLNEISWETEVWVAESPTHMIHFNGERFLGPHE
jgi:adenine-specific DNA-methyltransferase